MKNYIFLALLFCTHACFGIAIDKIKTKRDVITFLDKYLPDTVYHESQEWNFFHPDARRPTDSFYIVDFDRNGLNDLIIDGSTFALVLDNGKQGFKILSLSGARYSYKGIRKTDSMNHLLVSAEDYYKHKHLFDTALVYKWDALVEHVPNITNHNIDSLEYKMKPGFGGRGRLKKAVFHANGSASFYYLAGSGKNHVKAQTTLPAASIQNLWAMLEHMHFDKLPDDDGGEVIDMGKVTFRARYANGKTKTTSISHGYNPLALYTLVSIIEDHFESLRSPVETPLTSEEEDEFYKL